jgi:GNAT superfamily N-acetyltransferase
MHHDTRLPEGFEIREACSAADYAAFADICRAYLTWCRDRYASLPWFVEAVFGHQALDAELAMLAEKYGPPAGRTLLLFRDDAVVGGGAYRRMADGACELKRLFLTDAARGHGLGRQLTLALIALAAAEGFATMRLDTADRLIEAIVLYRGMGFAEVAPFHDYPAKLLPHLIFMERRIGSASA